MYEELIAALRYNGRDYKGSLMDEDDKRMCGDAADAIERLTDEVDHKDKALQAWVKTWESRKENTWTGGGLGTQHVSPGHVRSIRPSCSL